MRPMGVEFGQLRDFDHCSAEKSKGIMRHWDCKETTAKKLGVTC